MSCDTPCPLALLCLQEKLDEDNLNVCECGICPMCGTFWVSFYGEPCRYNYHMFTCPERRVTAAQIWRWYDRFKTKPDGDLRNAIANDAHISIPDTMYSRDRMGRTKGYIQVAPCHGHHHLQRNHALGVIQDYIREKYGDQAA